MKPPATARAPIRVGVHHVTPMLQSVIQGAIALSDDIEIVLSEDPTVDVIVVPESSGVLSIRSDVTLVSLCAQRPCTDVRSASELAAAIRHVARRDPSLNAESSR